MALLSLITLTYICYAYASLSPSTVYRNSLDVDQEVPSLGVPRSVQQSWVMYSPYYPSEPYVPPPEGCSLDQVRRLQRHGARYPTSGAATRIVAAIGTLQSVESFTDPLLAFLKNYSYDLGHDDLVPYGAAQSFQAGEQAFERYAWLLSEANQPFVRASSAPRVVDSATNWTAGFAAASSHHYKPILSVILSEAGNDTLDDNMCAAAGSSDAEDNLWLSTFAPPMTARLNAGAPGANLTDTDTYNILSMCAFDTISHETRSPFCAIYEELAGPAAFSYYGDLDKYYGTGYGQPLGPVQGVGYINELIARLAGKPVQDHTQTNATLNGNPETFPLNRTLYADFSHDNQMVAIFAAMGLFKQSAPLDPTKPDPNRTWRVQKMVPFSGRMVTERLSCRGTPSVRILVNDAVMPSEFCGANADRVCTLDAFVQSQSYARNNGEGDWAKCFA
ncbi:phytase [Dichomitus squalens]|nr:phytase [Dichomitus squalens]